ncbi:MAG TPA: XdhC family protein [Polyangiaceae bacterium]|nr:XdhC family protein [Polyangiaceae bacterium]
MRAILQALSELLEQRRRGALATVVRTSGSVPQVAGARLLLRDDGTSFGTVGGGAIEHSVREALERVLATGRPELLQRDLAHDLGMCCGGRMEVFVERVEPPPRLWLIGAGHVALATAPLARRVGFEVSVVDEREELNSAVRFPDCELRLAEPSEVLRKASFTPFDWILIATHDHQLDEQSLHAALATSARYIGLVGSRRKVLRLVQRVALKSATPPSLERLFAPVGLDIGAVSPEEIAVSIVAELVAVRNSHPAPHLRTPELARAVSAQAIGDELGAVLGLPNNPTKPPPA